MKILQVLETVGPAFFVGMIAYLSYLFYHILKYSQIKKANHDTDSNFYLRMSVFAVIGFIVFFSATWFRLKQIGAFEWGWNPYTGPPPMMTCLFVGSFGITLGAIVGLITGKKKNPQEKHMPNPKT